MSLPNFISFGGTSTNYPAGVNPWNGTPVEAVPAFTYFTPGVSVPAQVLNSLIGTLARQNTIIPSLAINTWGPSQNAAVILAGLGSAIDVLAYDEYNKMWVAAGHTSPALSFSIDDGVSWLDTTAAMPVTTYTAIAPCPAGNAFIIVGSTSTNVQLVTVNGVVTDTGYGFAGATGAAAFPLANGTVGVIYSSATQNAKAFKTANDGTGITDVTAALPASWKTAASFVGQSYFTYALGPANDCLIAFGGTTPTTDPSKMLYVSWNGSAYTFTAVAPAGIAGTMISSKSIRGVGYNATQKLWGIAAYDGTNTTLYTSGDLVNWFSQGIIFGGAVGGFTAVLSYWLATASMTLGGVTRYRAWSSLDGVNWFPLGGGFNLSAWSGITKLAVGAGNAAIWNVNEAQVSHRIG